MTHPLDHDTPLSSSFKRLKHRKRWVGLDIQMPMELYQQPSDFEIELLEGRMDVNEYRTTKDTISYCSKVSHR